MNGIEQGQNNQNKRLHELVKDVKYLDKLKLLLQQPGIDVDFKEDGSTALYKAALFGNADAVELLLQHSANINSDNSYGRFTVLMAAVIGKHIEVIKKLLSHPDINVNAQDGQQSTALNLAIEHGCSKCAILLLNHPSIDINIKDNLGKTPLARAAYTGNEEVVSRLLSRPDVEVNFVDIDRETPLHKTVSEGHIEIVKLLLADPRTNVDITNRPFHNTAYDIAVEFGAVEIINLLNEHKNSHSFGDVLSPGDYYEERKSEPRSRPKRPPIIDMRHPPNLPRPGWRKLP